MKPTIQAATIQAATIQAATILLIIALPVAVLFCRAFSRTPSTFDLPPTEYSAGDRLTAAPNSIDGFDPPDLILVERGARAPIAYEWTVMRDDRAGTCVVMANVFDLFYVRSAE